MPDPLGPGCLRLSLFHTQPGPDSASLAHQAGGFLEPMNAEIAKEDSPSKDLQVKGHSVLPTSK